MTPADVLKLIKEKEVGLLRPALHGHAREGTAHHHPDAHGGRGLLRRRQDVRRLLDRRMEGHQRVRHDPDAGSVDRDDRSVLPGDHAAPALRRRRTDDDAGLQPRSALAREARRGLPQVHRHRRLLPVRPRERILHLRQRALEERAARLQLRHRFRPGRVEFRHGLRRRQHGPSSRREGRLFPGAAGGPLPGPAHRDVPGLRGTRPEGRGASPRGRHRRPGRDQRRPEHADEEGRRGPDPQVRALERRARPRQDAHLHAEAARRRQRQRHARAPVAAEGRQEHLLGRALRGPVRRRALLHRRHHQAREGDQCLHQPGHEQLQAPGAGLRGAGHARLQRAQPLGLDPHPLGLEPEGPAHRSALPGLEREPVFRVRLDDDGGPRRHPEQDPSRATRRTRTCTTCRRKRRRTFRRSAIRSTWRSSTSTATATS